MTIEEIYNKHILRDIIKNVGKLENPENLKDLEQDLYLYLLTKNNLENIAEKDINFYLTKIVLNNINSKTSRYYYTYKKNNEFIDNEKQGEKINQCE